VTDVDRNRGDGFRKACSFFARLTATTACGMRCMRQAAIFFTELCRITNFSDRIDGAALTARQPRARATKSSRLRDCRG